MLGSEGTPSREEMESTPRGSSHEVQQSATSWTARDRTPGFLHDGSVEFLPLELPDGSVLLVDRSGLSPAATRELEAWSVIVPGEMEDTRAGDLESWRIALEAGPLLVAVVTGVLGNAAWSVFPAAARWLRSRREAPTLADTAAAAAHAISGTAMTLNVPADELSVTSVTTTPTGWKVSMSVADGRSASATVIADGSIVHLTTRRHASR